MRTQSDCIFCKIVADEIGSIPVFEDDHTLAFMDINPVARGHTLIVPKQHWQNLYEMPDEHLGYVSASAKRIAVAVKFALNPDGVSLIQANGQGASQSVLHFHMHIVPRTMGDELKINWQLRPGDLDEIREVAAQLAAAVEPVL